MDSNLSILRGVLQVDYDALLDSDETAAGDPCWEEFERRTDKIDDAKKEPEQSCSHVLS
jgi:hypothetical protein